MNNKKGIELLSERIIRFLFSELSKEEKEVLSYGATILLSTLGAYLLLIIISSLFNVMSLALIAAVTASLLRIFSGGVHASKFRNCVVLGTIIFTGLGLIVNSFGNQINNLNVLLLIILTIGSLIIYLYAPAEVKEKPISNQERQAKFKVYSFVIFSSVLFIYYILNLRTSYNQLILSGLLGASWQLFSLTPVAYKLFNRRYNN